MTRDCRLVAEAYKAARIWGLRPHEFWRLHPTEFLWEMEARAPAKKYGDLNEDEVAELYDAITARTGHVKGGTARAGR